MRGMKMFPQTQTPYMPLRRPAQALVERASPTRVAENCLHKTVAQQGKLGHLR